MPAGTSLLGAGYCLYSSSTVLVLTLGNGVNGFTYDSNVGEFILSHPNVQIPEKGAIYSFNEGNYQVRGSWWFAGTAMQDLPLAAEHCRQPHPPCVSGGHLSQHGIPAPRSAAAPATRGNPAALVCCRAGRRA